MVISDAGHLLDRAGMDDEDFYAISLFLDDITDEVSSSDQEGMA